MSKIARTIAMKLCNRQEFKRSRYNSYLNKDTSLKVYQCKFNKDRYFLSYAGNDIAHFDGKHLKLDNCGYTTKTTKRYLNAILSEFYIPFTIVQRDFVWYLEDNNYKLHEFTFPLVYNIISMQFEQGTKNAEFKTKLKQYE